LKKNLFDLSLMEIMNLSAGKLRDLIKLVERREALTSELEKLEASLTALVGGSSAPAAKAAPAKAVKATRKRRKNVRPKAAKLVAPTAKAPATKAPATKAPATKAPATAKAPAPKPAKGKVVGRRGKLKASILGILETAGPEGIAVKDIAAKLKAKPQNIHVWFSSTGKNVPGLIRVSEGRYRLKS
jgi:septal ring factor EnvC (AmiA/AmiB activator)